MSEPDPDDPATIASATAPMRNALTALLDCQTDELLRLDFAPNEGTPAWRDDVTVDEFSAVTANPTEMPRILARVHMAAVEEMSRAVCTLLAQDSAMLVADRVLVRSVVEIAGRATWLLEAGIPTKARVARALLERLSDLQRQIELSTGGAHDHWTVRFDELVAQLRTTGCDVKVAKDRAVRVSWKGPKGDHLGRPGQRAAMERVMGGKDASGFSAGEHAQIAFSLAVHGHPISMLMHADQSQEHQSLGNGMVAAPLMARSTDSNLMLAYCGIAVREAGNAFRSYMGWRSSTWERLNDESIEATRAHVPILTDG